MKKLFLLMTMAVLAFGLTSCNVKEEFGAQVKFSVAADCKKEDFAKIENLMKSKGLPIGLTMVSVEGNQTDLELHVKQMVVDFITKVTVEEIKALNTGATYVDYSSYNSAFSIPTITARKNL